MPSSSRPWAPACALALVLSVAPSAARAATFVVTTTLDFPRHPSADACDCRSTARTGACTLRAAVQTANACPGADVVRLGTATYLLSQSGTFEDAGQTGDLDVHEELTIVGEGIERTFIDASDDDRILDHHGGPGSGLTVTDLTLQHGLAPVGLDEVGGCLRNWPSAGLMLTRVRMQQCGARTGGALYVVETNVHLIETTIRESTAFGAGGALFRASPVLIEDSFFDENVASVYGGGLAVEGNGVGAPLPVTLIRVHVRGNQATEGGGMTTHASSHPMAVLVLDSVFEANQALGSTATGGALLAYGGFATNQIHQTRFIRNEAGDRGGAIFGGALAVYESTFVGNTAARGGAMSLLSEAELVSSTFVANIATSQGGAIHAAANAPSPMSAQQITIAWNQAPSGSGIFVGPSTQLEIRSTIVADNFGGPECQNVTSLGWNLSPDPTCVSQATDLIGAPAFAYFGMHGGPTETLALTAASPAVDAADPVTCEPTDQRGVARPQGAGCDIGAYELVP
ncbi:MAG: hypothetical protein KC619_00025 [Myxococcales bacterium]|nr:hypothetical protein [Myxococcales bacterium]